MNAPTAIDKALAALIDQELMFTHYDVTKYARSFTDDNVRLSDVRATVGAAFEDDASNPFSDFDTSEYVIDVVNIDKGNGSSAQAVLYRPQWENSFAYDPEAIQTDKSLSASPSGCCAGLSTCPAPAATSSTTIADKAKQAAAAAAAVVNKFKTSLSPTASTGSKSRQVKIDNRGRVCIPSEYTKRIGASAGDVVYVHRSSVQQLLTIAAIKWSPASATYIGAYMVDCYGNVRIPEKVLNTCKVSKSVKGADDYVSVRSETDHIVVE